MLYLSLGKIQWVWRDGFASLLFAILGYVLVNVIFFALNFGVNFASPLDEIKKLAPQVLFLAAIPAMMRLSLTPRDVLLRSVPRAAAIGALLVLPLAIYQAFMLGEDRAEGGSGNSIPFALTCAFLSVASLIALLESDRRVQILGVCGFLAGYLGIFLSQTKGLMPVPLIGVALVLAGQFRHRLHVRQVLTVIVVLCVFVVASIFASAATTA